MYKVGMLCKHFKGTNLLEKNIYKIVALHVDSIDVDFNTVMYSGDSEDVTYKDLVVYANIFQNNKLFAREYKDLISQLTDEQQQIYGQTIRVQPLDDEEIAIVSSSEFKDKKLKILNKSYKREIISKK